MTQTLDGRSGFPWVTGIVERLGLPQLTQTLARRALALDVVRYATCM
jgi:hypothetical protein